MITSSSKKVRFNRSEGEKAQSTINNLKSKVISKKFYGKISFKELYKEVAEV